MKDSPSSVCFASIISSTNRSFFEVVLLFDNKVATSFFTSSNFFKVDGVIPNKETTKTDSLISKLATDPISVS